MSRYGGWARSSASWRPELNLELNLKLSLGLCLVLLSGGLWLQPADAASLKLGGITINATVPSGWKTVNSGPQGMILRSADGSLDVILWILEPEQAKSMSDTVLTKLQQGMTEVYTAPSPDVPVRFKEYDARFVSGTGKLKGQSVSWECARLEMEKTVIVVRLARKANNKQAEKEFNALLQSLRPVAKP